MKRHLDQYLIKWKAQDKRKPLILKGARQVGKTTQVRQFAKQQFEDFVELNFESIAELTEIFTKDLTPQKLLLDIELLTQRKIEPGKTLLFLDEVQICPRALIALRYFYEELPELHVIAAGSLIEFAIEKVGVPVGRVTFLHMYPMSFIEFLWALNHEILADAIQKLDMQNQFHEVIHAKALRLFGEYIAIGGMPEAVANWRDHRDYQQCIKIHYDLIIAYQQDFDKYARKAQIKYLELLFARIPSLVAAPFQFTQISEDIRKRELEPALELLIKANIISPIYQTSAQGMPLGAGVDYAHYKLIMVDVALTQALLGQTAENWILNPITQFLNKGAIAEAFVGQELLVYSDATMPAKLYYWQRKERGSLAAVDYVISKQQQIIPIEVKAGKGGTLRSMHAYLADHAHSSFGIRCSTQNFSSYEKIYSYPIYAVAAFVSAHNPC